MINNLSINKTANIQHQDVPGNIFKPYVVKIYGACGEAQWKCLAATPL